MRPITPENFDKRINQEIQQQRRDNRRFDHDDYVWLSILTNKVGDVAKTICKNRSQAETDRELAQCAAVIKAWLCHTTNPETLANAEAAKKQLKETHKIEC